MVLRDFGQKIKTSRCRWPGYYGIAHCFQLQGFDLKTVVHLYLEAAAAADVVDTQLIGLAGELVHLKSDEYYLRHLNLIPSQHLNCNLVLILGSRAKGNSGKSMKPCLPASGVWYPMGCMMR